MFFCTHGSVAYTHVCAQFTPLLLKLQAKIELRDAFAAQRLCDNESCETHHCHSSIPVLCFCAPEAVCKWFLPAV